MRSAGARILQDGPILWQEPSSDSISPLADFFAQYPEFDYNPSAPVTSEFYRMCRFFKWSKEQREPEREFFRDAMTQQFNTIYGTDVDSLSAWKNLCQVLRIDPIPDELNACRNVSFLYIPLLL
jgi:hypothetical protein